MMALPVGTRLLTNRRLRDAFGCFTTGVAIATVRRPGGAWTAVTVNSFVSVSLEPPLVSFSLATQARCLATFRACDSLAVSVLRHDDQFIAANFAAPSSCRWDGMPLVETPDGCLVVAQALAAFECTREGEYTAGDHVILVGRVRLARLGSGARPLAFFRGAYGSFTPDPRAGRVAEAGMLDGGEAVLGWG
jgi:flavin reductase (DIM6/NTAB) family NADH-FMN oxidoreductase RutF